MKEFSSLSVIVPCRNEEKHIGKCLDSIIENDFPADKLEVLVIDGMSDDGTREVVRKYADNNPSIRLINNPKKIAPVAMNIGIRESTGDCILILSAHSETDKRFLRSNIESINKYRADCVGGVIKTCPSGDSLQARSIAMALSHPFGVGNAYFRIGTTKPKLVDTVPYGCYRKEVFDKVGLFNENLVRNQDIEFNLRLLKAGGKIMLMPGITSYYYARPTLKALAQNNFMNGFWVINGLRFANLPFSMRHLIPLAFVTTVIFSAAAAFHSNLFLFLFLLLFVTYCTTDVFVSLLISRMKDIKVLFYLLLVFPLLHVSYGIGSMAGILRLTLSRISG